MKYKDTTILEIAQKRGSTAKTKVGAWRFLLSNLEPPQKRSNSQPYHWDLWKKQRRDKTWDGRAKVLGYDKDDPNTPGRIWDEALRMNQKWDAHCCNELKRDSYGALYLSTYGTRTKQPRPEIDTWEQAKKLVEKATKNKKIPSAYNWIEKDWKKGTFDGDAIHHEIYDIKAKPLAALLCIRETEGSKYGVKTLCKNYYLIKRQGKGVKVSDTKKSIAAKAAKFAGDKFGLAIDILEGKAKMAAPKPCPDGIAFKQVAILNDGNMASIYDGSPWVIGVERQDKAMKEHGGGLYVYDHPEKAAFAPFPPSSRHAYSKKAIIKCKVAGKYCRYGEKLAFSKCTPINIEYHL